MNIKTASDLKAAVEASGNEQYYFTRESMKFFGDWLGNYKVSTEVVKTPEVPNGLLVYKLSRMKPVKHNNQESAYFSTQNFRRIFPLEG